VCRKWIDPYTLDSKSVTEAESILRAGVARFPTDAYMALCYANFQIDALGITQSGMRGVDAASKLSPSLMCRFIIFVRQQMAMQHAAGTSMAGGNGMDLLG
jgi:hypothetical protein